jgi:nucleotide-binding universal stress UspA family protein
LATTVLTLRGRFLRQGRSKEADVNHDRERVIVVGIDGSDASRAALEFALHEADLRNSSVEVVTTWTWGEPYEAMAAIGSPEDARRAAEDEQEAAIHEVVSHHPTAPMMSRLVLEGDPGPTLVRAARGASYLVVGHTHKGVVRRALLGSVSEYCVRHSEIPVMVVPLTETSPGTPQVPAHAGTIA